jgi:hypothetical protein
MAVAVRFLLKAVARSLLVNDRLIGSVVLLFALIPAGVGAPRAAGPQDPDWPCVQPLVPRVSVGAVWSGPSLKSVDIAWRENAQVSSLVTTVSARRTPIDGAKRAIEEFAAGPGADRNELLTALFAGIFDTINADREAVIRGIQRYALRQRALGQKIAGASVRLEEMRRNSISKTDPGFQELSEQLNWDTRIFEDRERSLSAICEQPVLLEQRLFALAREIMAQLE